MSKDNNIVIVNKVMKWWEKDKKMARHDEAHQKKIYLWGARRAFGKMLSYNINIGKHGMGVWKFIEQLWKRAFQATRPPSKMSRVLILVFF